MNFDEWCIENNSSLLNEWDFELNKKLPKEYEYNSKEKVLWIYIQQIRDKEKIFRWRQSIHSRVVNGYTYRAMSRIGVFETFEEWATKNNPELLKEWDYELNKFGPNEYSSAEKEKVHWIKEAEKNEQIFKLRWEATIESRKYGSKCPQLSNQKVTEGFNDFKSYCIENHLEYLLEQWSDKNELKPNEVTPFANKKILWHCKVCNGEWKATLNDRQHSNCPYCSNHLILKGFNDFQTWLNKNPEKAKFLDKEECEKHHINFNNMKYSSDSHEAIYAKCPVCGYKWQTPMLAFIRSGCPVCCGKVIKIGFNDLKTVCKNNHLEYLIDEWDSENEKLMEEYTKGSHSSVGWICSECSHKWNASISNRMKHKGCPKCAGSKGEKRIIRYLDANNVCYLQEYTFSDCLSDNGRRLRFDFAILDEKNNLVCLIEYDGQQYFVPVHFTEMDEEVTKKNLESCKIRDNIKNEYCKKNNIPLIRIPYTEFKNTESILEKELKELHIL